MGSFATSLHVKANDAGTVADALRLLLLEEGYEPTEEEPERGWPMNPPSAIRAIHLSAAREGWVSLLDSEGIGSQILPATLSSRLKTHAIQFFVNDSDSWHYQLFYAGQTIDEFDSVPDDDDFDEDDDGSDDLAEMGGRINASEAKRVIQERAQQWQQQLLQNMPPHLREMQKKWITNGQIDPQEMQEYNKWMQTQMPNMLEQVRELMGGMSKATHSQNTGRVKGHLEHLRPLLKADVRDSRVLELMSKQGTFAEDALGEFLPLLGIAGFYANLSYQYLEEYTSDDLAGKSIHLVEHLKFKRSSGRGASHLRLVQ